LTYSTSIVQLCGEVNHDTDSFDHVGVMGTITLPEWRRKGVGRGLGFVLKGVLERLVKIDGQYEDEVFAGLFL
jgi:hypothetical protein